MSEEQAYNPNCEPGSRLRLLESVVGNANDAILVTESERIEEPGPKIVYVNESFTRTTGYTSQEVIGKTPRILQGPKTDRAQLDKVRSALSKNEQVRLQLLNYRKDGSEFWVEINIVPVADKHGRTTHFVSVQREITGRKQAEEELKKSEERLRAILVQYGTDIITILEADGTIRYESPALERMMGYRPEERVGKSVFEYLHPDELEAARRRFADFLENQELNAPTEYRFRHADGSWRYLEATASNLLDDPDVRGIVINTRDVSERRQMEQEVRESEERFRTVVEQAADALFIHDLDGRLVDVNQQACESLGYTKDELLTLSVTDIETNLEPGGFAKLWQRIISEGPITLDGIHRRKDGTDFPVEVRVGLLEINGGQLMLAAARDITERKALEEELSYQAFHDSLTGLPNRALFLDRLEHALARRDPGATAMLFLDLDNFKAVNDSLGHDVGDKLLVSVAERLWGCMRPEDTVARFGGDEFTILLEGLTDVDGARGAAERLMECLQTLFEVADQEIFLTTSIGIALSVSGRESPTDLMRNADVALYRAKEKGRAGYEIFDATMDVGAREQLKLAADLRQALEGEQLVLHYQPKVELATGTVVGVEALLRWEHPERGLVSPAEFVPIAEETGLIWPIGRWVLREACRQLKEWQRQRLSDHPLTVSVNLSARQFQHPDLISEVGEALEETGLEPDCLVLEITESMIMGGTEHNISMLKRLKDLGVKISIDDFGTGYSSLAYLKRFPVDELKIDRSFVGGLDDNPEDATIVEVVIGLASVLGLQVVAEGVETFGQADRLQNLRCAQGQGYYFARPLPVSQLEELLELRRFRGRVASTPRPLLPL